MKLVPDSHGLREFNHCHKPSGPGGGQFCSAVDGVSTAARDETPAYGEAKPKAKRKPSKAKQAMTDLLMNKTLARPFTMLGLDSMRVSSEAVSQWLEKAGKEYAGAKLPAGYKRMQAKMCYMNATTLVQKSDGALTYVEGLVYPFGINSPFGILHAWAVTKDGTVVDPTLEHPEQATYFGVPYDFTEYAAHIVKSKTYGILGGDDKHAATFLTSKGIEPVQADPRMAQLRALMQKTRRRRA